jgi:hypothetical protein
MAKFFSNWWDVSAFALLAVLHIGSWLELYYRGRLDHSARNAEDRRFGAQILSSSSAAGITAVSILIPASLLVVQLSSTGKPLPPTALSHVFSASLWFLGSLFLGLLIVFLVPLKSHKQDVRLSLGTGIPFGLQLLSLLFGMTRLIWGLYDALR